MIKCHLNRLMAERRLKVADVVRDTGLPRSTITALWNDTATRIELPTLSALCQYFGCDIAALLEFQPESSGRSDITPGGIKVKASTVTVKDEGGQYTRVDKNTESNEWRFNRNKEA